MCGCCGEPLALPVGFRQINRWPLVLVEGKSTQVYDISPRSHTLLPDLKTKKYAPVETLFQHHIIQLQPLNDIVTPDNLHSPTFRCETFDDLPPTNILHELLWPSRIHLWRFDDFAHAKKWTRWCHLWLWSSQTRKWILLRGAGKLKVHFNF